MADFSGNFENPYAPPEDSAAAEPAANQLKSACKWLRGMAWAGSFYPASSALQLIDKTRQSDSLKLLIMQCLIMGLVAIYMVWISNRLRRDFNKTYKLARWTAVIGGGLFFPILTIPAFMAVSQMGKYRRSHTETKS